VPSLEALLASDIDVAAVVTNPDRPAGRGMRARPSPVKTAARRAGLEVLQPERARDPALAEWVEALAPDAATVVAYGSILPADLLARPPLGFVNLHFSLLPAYRGAAPVQRALMEGSRTTGVSVLVLTREMDEGPLLASEEALIADTETAGSLGARLARLGAPLLVRSLRGYASGALVPRPQDHERATYAPKITADEARIDWSRSAAEVGNLVRACNPEPGAWTTLRGGRVKVLAAARAPGPRRLTPGEVEAAAELRAGCGDADVVLVEVQMAGRRRMTGGDAARGLRLQSGERFE
jgi:methionyl-tRNA formyltransferase